MTHYKPLNDPGIWPQAVPEDPDKRGGFQDPGGMVCWIATRIDAD